MGLFLKNKLQKEDYWTKIASTEELLNVLSAHTGRPKIFFKHSTRCGTSIMAIKSFENSWDKSNDAELYYIDVLRQRAASDELAMQAGVRHESPQVIVIKGGKLLYHASHGDIQVRSILKNLG